MKRYLMGVDNGGTYIKAAIFDEDGRQCFLEKMLSPAQNDGNGHSERDQQQLWENNCRCIRSLIERSGIDPGQVIGVAFAGQGKGLYAVDAQGRDIRPAITSADIRAGDVVRLFQQDGTIEKLRPKICQELHPYQPLVLLRWMRDHEPENYARIRWVLSMKDFLNFRMTGVVASDYPSQSGSPFIDLQTGGYDREILEAAGVADKWEALPPLKWPGEICGFVTEEAHRHTGLAIDTPVSVGMFDVNASALAMGVLRDDVLFLITGTWSINAYVSPRPVTDGSIMFNSLYFQPGYYQVEEGSPTSAGVLEWVIPLLYPDGAGEKDIYARLNADVANVDPAASEVAFLPFVHGGLDSDAICGAWIGMNASTGRQALLAAVYEGVAFCHRWHVERLKKNCRADTRYRLAGGVVNSPVWTQIFADILNAPMEIMQDKEFGAQGAAISAGVSIGMYTDYEDAVRRCVCVDRIVQPDPSRVGVYEGKYRRFKRYMKAVLAGE